MHIPDGFLSVPVAVILWIISLIVLAIAFSRVSRELGEREVPVMGVLAAAIFAGQMLNFSVTGGTSGHLMGAALATILLGPWASIIILTCVVGVQALIFQDGGLLAARRQHLEYGYYRLPLWPLPSCSLFRRVSPAAVRIPSCWAASPRVGQPSSSLPWPAALELALSGTSPANIAIPAMAGVHTLIGVGEGLITMGAVGLIYAARPDLLGMEHARAKGSALVWVAGGIIILLLAILSPLASSHPDGLEWVAEQAGFLQTARGPVFTLIPDYVLPGISDTAVATILAGIIGAVLVLAVALGVAYTRRRRSA